MTHQASGIEGFQAMLGLYIKSTSVFYMTELVITNSPYLGQYVHSLMPVNLLNSFFSGEMMALKFLVYFRCEEFDNQN
jgi:hypothetical protein